MTTQDFLPIVAEQREEFLSEDFTDKITRTKEKQIDLNSKLAQVMIGARRSGKPTLCRKVLREANVSAAYINFDDERLAYQGGFTELITERDTQDYINSLVHWR